MFDRVVKYLDLRRASKDTTHNTKPLLLDRARKIKKLQDTLTIPTHTYTYAQVAANYVPRLLFQFNVSVGYPFSFTFESTLFGGGYSVAGSLFVKWRVGTTVHRYRLLVGGSVTNLLAHFNNVYAGERIPSNCVFEFWLVAPHPILTPSVGLIRPLPLTLSRLRNPVTADDLGSNTGLGAPLEIADLGSNLPFAMPHSQENIVWLNN